MDNPNYYAVLTASVRYDKELKPNAKLLYAEITALSNMNGKCTASDSYFANLYGVTTKAIQTWLKQLEEKGYINREVVYHEGTKQIKHRYTTIVPYPMEQMFSTPMEQMFVDNNTTNVDKNNNLTDCNKWNDIAEQYGLEKIKKLTPSRQKHLNARIKDAGGEHEFYEVINKLLSKNDFYTGNNDRGWKATFDYFLNPNKFAKVLESYTPESQETFSLKSLHEWFECFLDLKDARVDILKRTAMTVSGENQDDAKEVLREVYAKHAKEQLTMEGWINKVKEKGKQ